MKEIIRIIKELHKIAPFTIMCWSPASVYGHLTFPQGQVNRTVRISGHYKETAPEDIQIIVKARYE